MKNKLFEIAEERVKKRAEKIAFEHSEGVKSADMQYTLYELYKSYINLGSRLMQEELLKESIGTMNQIPMKKIYIFSISHTDWYKVEASNILEAREKSTAKHPEAKFRTIHLKP